MLKTGLVGLQKWLSQAGSNLMQELDTKHLKACASKARTLAQGVPALHALHISCRER